MRWLFQPVFFQQWEEAIVTRAKLSICTDGLFFHRNVCDIVQCFQTILIGHLLIRCQRVRIIEGIHGKPLDIIGSIGFADRFVLFLLIRDRISIAHVRNPRCAGVLKHHVQVTRNQCLTR